MAHLGEAKLGLIPDLCASAGERSAGTVAAEHTAFSTAARTGWWAHRPLIATIRSCPCLGRTAACTSGPPQPAAVPASGASNLMPRVHLRNGAYRCVRVCEGEQPGYMWTL